jgi:hypothetical protein
MKKINEIKIKDSFESKNEQWWFSFISQKIEESDYSKINLQLIVKGGKVVNIKTTTEENFNIGAK